jgi:hypothetical protein
VPCYRPGHRSKRPEAREPSSTRRA